MNRSLTVLFFEDYFVCSILPNENAWEAIKINCSEKNLLYFYISGHEVRNDNFAKERFEANENDINVFGDFYELVLNSTKRFKKFELDLEPIHLLKDLVEQVKSAYADRIVSFIPELNINDEIPLNICFIPGINKEARELITNYFLQEGFKLNSKADYFESFLKILHLKGIVSSKINLSIIETYFGDLLFHYIEYDNKIVTKESESLIGKGIDHRIGNLAKLMVEKAARQNSSNLLNDSTLLEKEIKKYHRRAALEINNFEYHELEVKIELSDFTSARVRIDERDLEKISAESFQFFKFKYESFISKHSNLARTEKIILNGDILSSDSFLLFFQKSFGASKIIKPFSNFSELLSRGVFANAPVIHKETIPQTDSYEIKITVTANQFPKDASFTNAVVNIIPPLPGQRQSGVPPLPPPPVQRQSVVPPPPPPVQRKSVAPLPPPPPMQRQYGVPPPPPPVQRQSGVPPPPPSPVERQSGVPPPPPPPPVQKQSVVPPPPPPPVQKKQFIPPPPPPRK